MSSARGRRSRSISVTKARETLARAASSAGSVRRALAARAARPQVGDDQRQEAWLSQCSDKRHCHGFMTLGGASTSAA